MLKKLLLAAALSAAPALALAQGTITNGGANYVLTTSHWDVTPEANFTGVGAGDAIFEAGWWFRIEGDTQETIFGVPTTQNYTGDTATITWANVATRNFSATKTHVIVGGGGNGEVRTTMTVTNNGASTITLHLFQATDWDVNGTAAGDSATLVAPGHIRITDGTAGFAESRTPDSVGVMARPFAATTDVFGLLADTSVTNFDGSGLPFTNGDITLGMQWTFTLAAGASATATLYSSSNRDATPVQLQHFSVD